MGLGKIASVGSVSVDFKLKRLRKTLHDKVLVYLCVLWGLVVEEEFELDYVGVVRSSEDF